MPAETCSALADALKHTGILARVTPHMRIVIHLDVSRAEVERTIAAFKAFFAAG